jgi:hypothetical protein
LAALFLVFSANLLFCIPKESDLVEAVGKPTDVEESEFVDDKMVL